MAVDASLAGFQVEAFALPRSSAAAARALHADQAQPPAAVPTSAPRARPPNAPQTGRATVTPQETIQQHWAARDATIDAAALSTASRQECIDVDAIRARHGQPPAGAEPLPRLEPRSDTVEAPRASSRTLSSDDPHGVFDRMAASLSYANTFDAGDVRLLRRFDEMNAALDGDARRQARQREQAAVAAQSQHVVDDLSLMQDLVSLRDKLGVIPESEMKEPPGPLPGQVSGTIALDPAQAPDTQSLQQDLESLRAMLGNDVATEELKEPPGALPPAAVGAVTLAEATSVDIPLSPETGGRSIDESTLAIGDIILSTTNAFSSGVIRVATGSPVSHAALYIGGGQVVEAIGQGVVMRTLADAIADDTVAVAFRYPGLTEMQALQVRDFVGQHLDQRYATLAAIRSGLFRLDDRVHCRGKEGAALEQCRAWRGRVHLGTPTNDEFFCSHLVLAAYDVAGVPLTTTRAEWNTPQDIVQLTLSKSLAYVGHLKTS